MAGNQVAKVVLTAMFCWVVTGSPLRTIDGDTFEMRLKVWQQIEAVERVRLLGVDTPEVTGTTKFAGLEAKAFTEKWLAQGDVTLATCKRDSFGRVLADVTRGNDNLGALLKDAGHTVEIK